VSTGPWGLDEPGAGAGQLEANITDGKAIQGIENWIGGQIGKLEIFKAKKERLSFKRAM